MKIRGAINNKIRSQFFSGCLFPELQGQDHRPVNAFRSSVLLEVKGHVGWQ